MRSRYAAFARGEGAYLAKTQAKPVDPGAADELARWGRSVAWLGLTISSAPPPQGDEGTVHFQARYLEAGAVVTLDEESRFARRDGAWVYVDGKNRHQTAKVGRNEPCPCGSGKKLKQCHG